MSTYIALKEDDFGSKGRAKRAIEKIRQIQKKDFHKALNDYWKKVLLDAKRLCPKDTTTLSRTIRWQKNIPRATIFPVGLSPKDERIDLLIVAGGGNWINPKTKRQVDYAKAVHDGTIDMPPRPFLRKALDMNEDLFRRSVELYLDKIVQKWKGS